MTDRHFKVLCIDGGGVRGIFATKILSLIETKFNVKIHDTFDLIVGTSTGSIVTGAIAINYDLTALVDDYSRDASKIFQKQFSLCGLLKSKYDSRVLSKFLHDKLGDKKLGEIEKPIILNATNASVGDVHIFKSSYQNIQRGGDYVRDGDVPLFKAVLASCSAPTYFDPVDIDGTLVCDGGIWANNPSLVGYIDAIRNFKSETKDIKILSIGTGQMSQIYQSSTCWGFWGLMSGWQNTKLVDFMMSCQTIFPQNALHLIDNELILRINPKIDYYALDDYEKIPILGELAKSEFTNRNVEIKNFLNI